MLRASLRRRLLPVHGGLLVYSVGVYYGSSFDVGHRDAGSVVRVYVSHENDLCPTSFLVHGRSSDYVIGVFFIRYRNKRDFLLRYCRSHVTLKAVHRNDEDSGTGYDLCTYGFNWCGNWCCWCGDWCGGRSGFRRRSYGGLRWNRVLLSRLSLNRTWDGTGADESAHEQGCF